MTEGSLDHLPTAQISLLEKSTSLLQNVQQLLDQNAEANKKIRLVSMQQLAADQPLTAIPYSEGNTSYQQIHSIDREEYLKKILHGRTLDIGAGGINQLQDIIPTSQVITLDIDRLAKSSVQADARKLPFANESFDSVYGRNIHTENPSEVIQESVRVLKKGGNFVFELSYADIESYKDEVIGVASIIHEVGVTEENVQFTLDLKKLKNESLDIELNSPVVFISIKK